MRTKKKAILRKLMAMMICAVLLAGNVLTFAATDVDQSHWANAFVSNTVASNIMPLYSNGAFNPESVVTNLETITVIYRTAKASGLVSDSDVVQYVSKHEASLKGLGIPAMIAPYGSDAYPALAFALEKGILTLDEIKVFVSGTTLTNVKKVNAVVFVAKALNYYKQENLNKIILLSYKDAAEISLTAVKYVNLLIEHGIISSKGDAEGKFNPNAAINRATMSVLADGLYKSLMAGVNTPPNTTEGTTTDVTEPVIIEATKTVSGTVKSVDDGTQTVTLTTSTGKVETYSLIEAQITAAGQKASFNSIVLGTQMDLTVKNGVAISAVLDKIFTTVEGKFSLLTDYLGAAKVKRSLRTELPSGSYDYKSVYDDTIVTIDGMPSKASELQLNYRLIVYYDGFDAKRIVAFSDQYEFYGILDETIDLAAPGKISITQESGNVYMGTLNKSVLYLNASQGFKKGDIVKVTTAYGEVTKLEYLGQAKTVVGTINGIHIKKTPELSLILSSGKSESNPLASRVKILNENGESSLTIYDLRLDQEVTVSVGIGGITSIQLGRKLVAEPTGIKVTVQQVVESSNILLVTDESNRMRTVTFPVGSAYKAIDYKAGNQLYIEGKAIADTLFEVINITIQTK